MSHRPIDLIFETSWEVCNKIGGIYTVLSTKAKSLQKLYKDKVIFIGPDVWTPERPCPVFTESKSLLKKWRLDARLPEGVDARVGRWDIPGKPIAVLVKFDGMYASKDEAYARMWQHFGVDSLHAYGDYDEGCAFGRAAAAVIESLIRHFEVEHKAVVAHFDEWTTGMGLLETKLACPGVATVFTTHATSIGRSICGNGKPLYDYLSAYDGDQMARELNMESKHSLEKAAAREADAFTTVSEVTARECEQLLCRRPDVLTPNGFEPGFVPAKAKYKQKRAAARERVLRMARALTGRELSDDTFLMCTSGRCEYRNKGLDMMLDVMARIDETGTPTPVVAVVAVPAWSGAPREDLREAVISGVTTRLADPVITHALHNYDSDPVNGSIHRLGFASVEQRGPVSVIYVPCYLSGDDGILNLDYYDFLTGMDATVFPSYYEPWGYTPLESVAFGIPTVTTTLAGFGQWVKATSENSFADCGVSVIERTDSNYEDAVKNISASLSSLMEAPAKERAAISAAAAETAARADWAHFISYYEDAYDIALGKHQNQNKTKK